MEDTEQVFTHSNHPALYYEDMLADQLRMQRYRQAISAVVKAGDVVADLGTGMGVLAMMAAQAGAAKVYAIDNRQNVLTVAERIIAANGLAKTITLVHADARQAVLDEPVDVIINELIGDFGTDENIYECVSAFAAAHLKPGGKVLPQRLKTMLVPVQYDEEFRGVWKKNYQGLDLSEGLQLPAKPEPVMRILQRQPLQLARPAVLEDITFSSRMAPRELEYTAVFDLEMAGRLEGFLGYFTTELANGISLANHPAYPYCHWQTWHWPLYPPVQVRPGEGICARVHARPNMIAPGWTMDWEFSEG